MRVLTLLSSLVIKKPIGTVYCTLTGLPSIDPGIHFGMEEITLAASDSQPAPMHAKGFASETEPSRSITNETYTFPDKPTILATSGYFRFLMRYLLKAGTPPGK